MVNLESKTIGDLLDSLPAPATRQLTTLHCAKLALAKAVEAESLYGPLSAEAGVLRTLADRLLEPLRPQSQDLSYELRHLIDELRNDNRSLFKPLPGMQLSAQQEAVYRAALCTVEIQIKHYLGLSIKS